MAGGDDSGPWADGGIASRQDACRTRRVRLLEWPQQGRASAGHVLCWLAGRCSAHGKCPLLLPSNAMFRRQVRANTTHGAVRHMLCAVGYVPTPSRAAHACSPLRMTLALNPKPARRDAAWESERALHFTIPSWAFTHHQTAFLGAWCIPRVTFCICDMCMRYELYNQHTPDSVAAKRSVRAKKKGDAPLCHRCSTTHARARMRTYGACDGVLEAAWAQSHITHKEGCMAGMPAACA